MLTQLGLEVEIPFLTFFIIRYHGGLGEYKIFITNLQVNMDGCLLPAGQLQISNLRFQRASAIGPTRSHRLTMKVGSRGVAGRFWTV